MPTKRTRTARPMGTQVTDTALESYLNGDYLGLHRALRLPPWHLSPLPLDRDPLGVDPDEPPDRLDRSMGALSWKAAVEWQHAIEAELARRKS